MVAAEPPDHVASGLIGGQRDPGERVVPDAVRDGEALHLQAEAFQLLFDDLLGFLLAAHRSDRTPVPRRVLGGSDRADTTPLTGERLRFRVSRRGAIPVTDRAGWST